MAYATGLHPHIRSSDSLAGRYWTSAALLFPAVIFRILEAPAQFLSLPAFFLTAAVSHFIFNRISNSGWTRGILPLLIFLWFLILPLNVSFPAAITGFAFLLLMYEASGGLGAYALHPVLGGFLVLRLFYPQQVPQETSGGFFIWNFAEILFLAFGGIYLGLQKKIRLLPVFIFAGSAFFPHFIAGRPASLELFRVILLLGFYVLTDTAVSPLKKSAHAWLALGAGLFMSALVFFGSGILLAGVLSLAVSNLAAQIFDSSGFTAKGPAHA